MGILGTALNWYQKKIGAYDKQLWEHSIEARLSRGVNVVPKKLARIKTELIDVDLVRGSTFSKAKPQQSWITATCIGLLRVVLLPFYANWWKQQTCTAFLLVLLHLYCLHWLVLYLYFVELSPSLQDVPTAEVVTPVVMVLVLGVVHSQVVATLSPAKSPPTARRKRAKLRKARTSDKSSQETTSEEKRLDRSPSETNLHHSDAPGGKKNSDEESGLDSLGHTPPASDGIPAPTARESSDEFFVARRRLTFHTRRIPESPATSSGDSEDPKSDWPPLISNSDCNSDSSDSQVATPEPLLVFPEALSSAFNSSFTSSDKVSCTIWEGRECKKVDLSAAEISCAVVRKADNVTQSTEYLAMGLGLGAGLACLPLGFRLLTAPGGLGDWRASLVISHALASRFLYSSAYFFLLAVAERTYKQRFLYAKHFCHLTSSRRARKWDLPHFRLNKVRNIKTWLSVRSYLKKRGPQRSVDTIVSTAFIIQVCILSFLCVQLLRETAQFRECLYCCETTAWSLALGVFLLRFMTLGSKMANKYRSLSALITEQINLYLHMEQKPHKKEELMLANSVLKLAADLLKELESPFKISGLYANPYLYHVTKVVVLSAFSAVLTELLGFKLKLHNIKIK